MDLFANGFRFPELIKDPLNFQSKLSSFFNSPPPGFKVLKGNNEYINGVFINGLVFLAPGVELKPFTVIDGHVLIDEGSIVGPQCSLKGDVVIGRDCRLGRCEIDNSIILNGVKAYHHSYIGHSIIGHRVNIAAGFITANLRFDEAPVKVSGFGDSSSRKFGALIGDGAKTMVNSFLMPGSIVERDGIVKAPRGSLT